MRGQDALNLPSSIWQGQYADDLRKVGVRGGADEQATWLIAILLRVETEPGSRAAARTERVLLKFRCLVKRPSRAAFAPDAEFRQLTCGPPLVPPQLPTAAIVCAMNEPDPVEVVHVALGTGADEARRHDPLAIETTAFVEQPAVNETTRAVASRVVLNNEPFREAPCWGVRRLAFFLRTA